MLFFKFEYLTNPFQQVTFTRILFVNDTTTIKTLKKGLHIRNFLSNASFYKIYIM